MKSLFAFSISLVISVAAQDLVFPDDPYLAYRPPFARSLPVQIMLTGVVLTLVAVLFIHLMFTAQYHWPLAPVNYVLQLSGVTTLLISLIATIHVVLSATFAESEKWPYMLSYIAVNVPPLDLDNNTEGWSIAERATWLVMNASTSGLIQITHIQFLTLLYPSRLEGRLIFALLGPLAVVAAVMQLLPISSSTSVNNIASIVRNVCNATLSLLFTLALFIWGLLVNRKQAWRTDGGTAVFGCAALSLAVVSTALNFLYVHKEEEFVWLPGLMWAVVLWQSFLGWWWWVGAGSNGGYSIEDENVEEKLRRGAKREARKKEAQERKKEKKIKAQKVWRGVAGAFAPSSAVSTSAHTSLDVRSKSSGADLAPNSSSFLSNTSQDDPDVDEPSSRRHRQCRNQDNDPSTADSSHLSHADSATITGNSLVSISGSQVTLTTAPRLLPGMIHRWYTSLRHAHNAAARVQAAERVERIREMGRGRSDPDTGGVSMESWGWSWEGLGWRRGRRAPSRRASEEEEVVEEEGEGQTKRSRRTSRSRREEEDEVYEMRGYRAREVDEEEDADAIYVSAEDDARRRSTRTDHGPEPQTENTPPDRPVAPAAAIRPRSVWWWGPLRRWRLQDSTIY